MNDNMMKELAEMFVDFELGAQSDCNDATDEFLNKLEKFLGPYLVEARKNSKEQLDYWEN